MTQSRIYKVVFKVPPFKDSYKADFYFSSLLAIYDTFTEKQIGCKVNNLWNLGISDGHVYNGKLCMITSEVVTTKAQKKPRSARK